MAYLDYHRTVVGYHGTSAKIADALVDGTPFSESSSVSEWLGTGVYFWEYAPKQALWWANKRKKISSPAVVGAMIRLRKLFRFTGLEKYRCTKKGASKNGKIDGEGRA